MGVSETVRAGLAARGSYLNRYVTDEQRSRGTIFVATLWAGNGCPAYGIKPKLL